MSYIVSKAKKKGFDNYIQDHCYLEGYRDANTEEIGSNVQVTEKYEEMDTNSSSTIKQRIKNTHIIKGQDELKRSPNSGSQQIIYLPTIGYCTEHETGDLLLLEDERLVKPGDKFKTHNDFVQYLNENAKRWFYYYKCFDSRKPNTEQETYLYTCVYLRNKEKYVKKGLRKRNNNNKTNCPCKIKLRHLPHEKELTVVFVCNHHDHPLSEEEFYKLQHGRRLPPHIKEEIMDLLTLQVDLAKIRKYVQIATGFNMSRAFFYGIERTLKSRNVKRHISDEKVRTLMKRLNGKNIFKSIESSRSNDPEDKINESETLQSVRNLEESVKCETQHNPWITDQCVPVLSNGALTVLTAENVAIKENRSKQLEEETVEMIIPDIDETQCDNEIIEDNVQELENNEDICMPYETVVSRPGVEYGDNVNEYVYNDLEEYNDHNDSDNEVQPASASNCDEEIIEYVNDDAEIVEYAANNENECANEAEDRNNECDEEIVACEGNYEYINEAKDAQVQTSDKISKQNPLVSVFDVCMKDGNVTGFIINNDVMNRLKYERVEKGVQTEDINNSDSQSEDTSDTEATADSYIELTPDGTHYIKHEYIHKYNIDRYMCRPNFPKYIEVLSKKTGIEVIQMFTNVYNERAMFKMITTQSDREGNTRILYVTNPHEIPYNVDMKKREELGKRLKEVFILKGKVRALEMKNTELEAINKQLITSLR